VQLEPRSNPLAAPAAPEGPQETTPLTDHPYQFVINRLRLKPIDYTINFSHFASGGEWQFKIGINDLDMSDIDSHKRVIGDLEAAIAMLNDRITEMALAQAKGMVYSPES
jgi:hypothetical protein